jgi:hypothetical protein
LLRFYAFIPALFLRPALFDLRRVISVSAPLALLPLATAWARLTVAGIWLAACSVFKVRALRFVFSRRYINAQMLAKISLFGYDIDNDLVDKIIFLFD